MTARVLLLVIALCPWSCATPTVSEASTAKPGIDLDLAQHRRSTIAEVHYDLLFRIGPGMSEVRGELVLGFDLAAPQPVVLDFDGEELAGVRINGREGQCDRQHNHLVLAAADLRAGRNEFRATFASKVAATGTPLTVYKDTTDGAEYYYTLLVPADAHRLFPCFDQPDLKGRYTLRIDAPAQWQVVANGAELDGAAADGDGAAADGDGARNLRRFAETPPLPTYLFAFAAGPFATFERVAGDERQKALPMRMYLRKSKVPKLERDLLFAMHDDSARWLGDYFAYPYPFGKLDLVLVPGFPYGGMEHAGAIFYRESALVFEQPPTEGELSRRSTLIYHEVSHQWFGNLVTMRWFDDLWLKEGFATFMGYTLFESLEPGKKAWLRFHHRVKPQAYSVDATAGTTPVYQKLQNLADAKSAYGAIVYNKAPAILRELNHRLGPATFQKGLQTFLRRHQFDNATWQQLVAALEEAAGESTANWSSRWILAPGMPRVQAQWSARDGRIVDFSIRQGSVQGSPGTWPLQVEVLLLAGDGGHRRARVVAEDPITEVAELRGTAAPACVLLNPNDVAYGQFLLDATSRGWLTGNAEKIADPLVRAVAMSALWETVREAQLDPDDYVGVALRLLRDERDAGTHAWLLGTLGTALQRYMPEAKSAPRIDELAGVLFGQLRGDTAAIKTQTLRFLMVVGRGDRVMELCGSVAKGDSGIPGLAVGKRDRFLAATALLGAGRGRGALEQLLQSFGDEDVAREAYIAGAADPDGKPQYFAGFGELEKPPEQWVISCLGNFHWHGQEAATLPFLRPALDRVEWVKEHRKVFFMPAWIDAFVNGHSSQAALDAVQRFLAEYSDLPVDIERKILQSLDGLRRAVEIRKRWK